ncbi:MAG: M15 family metallopeptidase [Candidatus Saccharimonadales bacterium]
MKKAVFIVLLAVACITLVLWWRSGQVVAPAKNNASSAPASKASTKAFNKSAFSTSDPASPWVIVNKKNPVNPVTYTPTDLRKPLVPLRVPGANEMQLREDAATALEKMFADAKVAGITVQVSTAYRGYAYQKTLYDGYVAAQGQANADTVSARPGYSEHQTGWAVDIRSVPDVCGLEACFGDTAAGKWLAANAYKHGYLLRYPSDKVVITGYNYEPWHFRYIGTSLSQELHKQQVTTLEEFFAVPGGDY